jgi:hypothetical protein
MIKAVLAVCLSLLFGLICSASDVINFFLDKSQSLETEQSKSTANHEAFILLEVTS